MEHVAIDLGAKQSQICVRHTDGTIIEEKRWPTAQLSVYLAQRPHSRVVVETCSEAFAVTDAALALNHEVRVVPATLVRSLGVGARRTKNDRRDAQILSEVSCRIDLPSVHVPSAQSRRRKMMCNHRQALVGSRTQLMNCVRSWLRTLGKGPLRWTSPTLLAARVRSHVGGDQLPAFIERTLETIEHLNEQIAAADRELKREATGDETCRRLMTVPGVGPVTAIRFVAAVDKVSRFDSAHKLEAYLGLTPGEDSSSERQRRTSITKAGPAALRWTLVQAAWSARRTHGDHPMVQWSLAVEQRRGKMVAITALARKLAGIPYALMRDGSAYDPLDRGAATAM